MKTLLENSQLETRAESLCFKLGEFVSELRETSWSLEHCICEYGAIREELDEIETLLDIAEMEFARDRPRIDSLHGIRDEHLSKVHDYDRAAQKAILERYEATEDADSKGDLLYEGLHRAAQVKSSKVEQLSTKEKYLVSEYMALRTQTERFHFRGNELPQKEITELKKSPDPLIRRDAWSAILSAHSSRLDRIDELFDELIDLRREKARCSGFSNYTGFRCAEWNRIGYGVNECKKIHELTATEVAPLAGSILARRARSFGVTEFEPADLEFISRRDYEGVKFAEPTASIRTVLNMISSFDTDSSEYLAELYSTGFIGVKDKPDSAPGCYAWPLQKQGLSYVYINSNQDESDIWSLLHEGGHAAHDRLLRRHDSYFRRKPGVEISEVAAVCYEFFGACKLDQIYEPADQEKASRYFIENRILMLPWIAVGDAFQIWLYENPDHTKEERVQKWIELRKLYSGGFVDFEDCPEHARYEWQSIQHFFMYPMYTVEYIFAIVTAIQLWKSFQDDPESTLTRLHSALSHGASNSQQEIWDKLGLRFDIWNRTAWPSVEFLERACSGRGEMEMPAG
jgi:oligoendopeptidase F